MRGAAFVLAGLSGLVLVGGCYQSRPGQGAPAGAVDGGGADAPSIDVGVVGDAPAILPDTGGCRDEYLPPYNGARCLASTFTCLGTCADGPCQDACLAADPACGTCIDSTLGICANSLDCQGAWTVFACCARTSPSCNGVLGLQLFGCAPATCEAAAIEWVECLGTVLDSGECLGEIGPGCGPL